MSVADQNLMRHVTQASLERLNRGGTDTLFKYNTYCGDPRSSRPARLITQPTRLTDDDGGGDDAQSKTDEVIADAFAHRPTSLYLETLLHTLTLGLSLYYFLLAAPDRCLPKFGR